MVFWLNYYWSSGNVTYAENKWLSPFSHRVMFQRGEKLCAIPTAGLKEEKYPDYVSITWWMSCPSQHRMQPTVPLYILTMDSLSFFYLDRHTVYLDFECVEMCFFFFVFFVMCNYFQHVHLFSCCTHHISKLFFKWIVTKYHRARFAVICFPIKQ